MQKRGIRGLVLLGYKSACALCNHMHSCGYSSSRLCWYLASWLHASCKLLVCILRQLCRGFYTIVLHVWSCSACYHYLIYGMWRSYHTHTSHNAVPFMWGSLRLASITCSLMSFSLHFPSHWSPPILPTCVPYLCLDGLPVHLDTSGAKFHTNCWPGLKIELVACKLREEIGFTYSRIPF